MPEIIALIDKNKSIFSMAPIGPIGMRISLKENKWALAVESAIASSLVQTFRLFRKNQFIVISKKKSSSRGMFFSCLQFLQYLFCSEFFYCE